MSRELWQEFIQVVKQEVVPALGCTEPVSVALAAAIAMEKLASLSVVKHHAVAIQAAVSPNLMKNGMGVGIPGTGMVGLPVAAAIGAIAGDAHAGLEVLKRVTAEHVSQARTLINDGRVTVDIADVSNVLYAKVTVSSATDFVTVTIADQHTRVVRIEENGIVTYIAQPEQKQRSETTTEDIFSRAGIKDIYQFAVQAPLNQIDFIDQAGELNSQLSVEGLEHHYGLQIGATFRRNMQRGLLASDLLTEVMTRTAAASDARMDGAMKPAMSNSGSGNQGIAATMPVVSTAEFIHASREQRIRALMLSSLTAIYIKSQQDKLSALCAATTASMGAAAGITWLLGGDLKQVGYAISSMIGDIAGIICDGAKTACAMKVSSSASAAVKASLMALDGVYVSGSEGIVTDDPDRSIRNLCALANGAMTQTDKQILEIMVSK